MIVACPECTTRFNLPLEAIPADGRRVRCGACKHVWHVDGVARAPGAEDADDHVEALLSGEATVEPEPGLEDLLPPGEGDEDLSEAAEVPETEEEKPPPVDIAETGEPGALADEAEGGDEPEDSPFDDDGVPPPLRHSEPLAIEGRGKPRHGDSDPLVSPKVAMAGWYGLAAFLVLVIGGTLLFRESLREAWPPSRVLYAAIGMEEEARPRTIEDLSKEERESLLSIEELPVSTRREDGMIILTVTPVVRNASDLVVDLPPMLGTLTDELGVEVHRWQFQPARRASIPARPNVLPPKRGLRRVRSRVLR